VPDLFPVLLTAGTGVVLLVVLVLLVLPPVRRFARARAALAHRLADGVATLRAEAGARRPGAGRPAAGSPRAPAA
jgi:hypothetical protein